MHGITPILFGTQIGGAKFKYSHRSDKMAEFITECELFSTNPHTTSPICHRFINLTHIRLLVNPEHVLCSDRLRVIRFFIKDSKSWRNRIVSRINIMPRSSWGFLDFSMSMSANLYGFVCENFTELEKN